MPNFSTVPRVLQTIRAGDSVERIRQENRVKITDSANCVPPLTEKEAEKMGIKINVNWGSLMILLAHGRRQYLSAFLSNQYFFKVTMPFAPKEHQSDWEAFVTQEANRPLRESLSYFELHRSRWSSVVSHGVGPMIWNDKEDWLPDFTPMCDLRIPTDTTLDFKNLNWFAVRRMYTPFELLNTVFDGRDKNDWDKQAVAQILKNYKEVNFVDATTNYNWETSPEKLAELVKQDGGYYSGDAMPAIPLWHFYFEDSTAAGESAWFLRVVPETGVVKDGGTPEDFLYQSDEPFADSREQILHCQFGDLTTDAPFKYHSVRSLGFALLEPEFYDNLTRCRLIQHIHDNFNIWLRTSDPGDKGRAQVQEFSNLGMLKPGVTVVPQNERHQIEPQLVEMGMAQMRQLKQEASSTYTQQLDSGTSKEQTAFETSVKMQQVNAMLGGLLLTAFKYEAYADREIVRRLCIKDTKNPDALRFQKRCREMGIPDSAMDPAQWEVEPVSPIGMGNPAIAQAASQQLMQARSVYPPEAQQEILHEFTQVVTGDARKAARWAPLGNAKPVSTGEEYVQGIFGTLMQGVPIRPVERISPIEQFEAMLPLFAGKITQLEQRDNMAKPEEAAGLSTVQQFLGGLIQRLAQDPQERDRVKQYGDALGQLSNQVEGLAQRGQEQAQKEAQEKAGGQMDPAVMAKVQAIRMTTEAKIQALMMTAKARSKMDSHKFVRDQRRADAGTFAGIQRDREASAPKNKVSESISFKDLPFDGQKQMAAQAGIEIVAPKPEPAPATAD